MATVQSQSVELHVGATRQIMPLLDQLGVGKVMLVVDEMAYQQSGAAAILEPHWSSRDVQRFSGFEVNPKLADVQRGVIAFRDFRPQLVLAIGGGTAIDLAKMIGTCGTQACDPEDVILGKRPLQSDGPPLVAVPTTAGTGSEATHFAVAYVRGEKYSLAHDYLLPEFVILDPELTASLPTSMTAASGLDALCQAIESLWAVDADEQSAEFADHAATLAMTHLQAAVLAPTPQARIAMMHAAHLSGKAINISKTTAPHAVSYAVTTHHGVPHGMAVALTISAFLEYNSHVDDSTCRDRRGVEHVRGSIARIVEIIGGANLADARSRLDALIRCVGGPTRLRDVGIGIEDLPRLVEQVNLQRLANNPRAIDAESLRSLLASCEK